MITKNQLHLSLIALLIYLLASCNTSALPTTATNTRSATLTTRPIHYQTNCPPTGAGRVAVMQQLANGSHQAIIYTSETLKYPNASGDNGGMARYESSLGAYDISKHQDTSLFTLPHTRILEAHLSYDRQWVLFVKDTGSQSILQMARPDGQSLQTLYCTSSEGISAVYWSPDQKYIALWEDDPYALKNYSVRLLNVTTGSITILLRETTDPAQVATPLLWLDNTHLYLNYSPKQGLQYVKLLDISKGENQPIGSLPIIATFHEVTFDLSIDRKQNRLFASTCVSGGYACNGVPSHIIIQSTTNKVQKVIYSSSTLMIRSMQVISNKALLFTADTAAVGDTNSGLWRIDQNGQNPTQLIRNTPGNLLEISDLAHNTSNISPDGILYAVIANDFKNESLEIGPLAGGPPTVIKSERYEEQNSNASDIVGWTTQ